MKKFKREQILIGILGAMVMGVFGMMLVTFLTMDAVPIGPDFPDTESAAYQVINRMRLVNGDSLGEVLIAGYTKDTPDIMLRQAARAIAAREGFDEVSLYCSRDGYEAQMSDSYSASHPGAADDYLGSLKSYGTFVSAHP